MIPPCLGQPNHEVMSGFCTRCGLVMKKPRKRVAPRIRRRRAEPSLHDELARLVGKHGLSNVEDALFVDGVWNSDVR